MEKHQPYQDSNPGPYAFQDGRSNQLSHSESIPDPARDSPLLCEAQTRLQFTDYNSSQPNRSNNSYSKDSKML